MGGRNIYFNGILLRSKVAASGLSDRALAGLTGLSYQTLRAAMSESSINTGTRLIELVRLAEEVGVTLGNLLDRPPPSQFPPSSAEPEDSQEDLDDARLLVQLLFESAIAIPSHRLAMIMDLPLWRVVRATSRGDQVLRYSGLRIHHAQTGLTIGSASASNAASVRAALETRDHDKELNNHHVRILHSAMVDGLNAHATRGPRAMNVAALMKRGYLRAEIGRQNKYVPSQEVAFAIDIDANEIDGARPDLLRPGARNTRPDHGA